jgi:branched-chain amino acid transport system ATP-binding protein
VTRDREEMIEMIDCTVKYGGITALDNISISIPDGKIVSIVGANGAGKTSTINAISGMVRVSSGKITLDGESLFLPPHKIVRKGIVQVPEGRKIFPTISVMENLILGAYTIKDKERIRLNMERVFKYFPILEERMNQPGGTLSGGEQQMLAIGRGLMAKPRLMMFDEPSLGLAPILVKEIFNVIKRIRNEGTTVLIVEQNVKQSLSISDRAYVLENGRIVMEGTGESMLQNEHVKTAYLGV